MGNEVLAIFTGPHAYISPSWYAEANVVPTWNYVAVHVYGRVRIDDDRDSRLQAVNRHVGFFESGMPSPWSLDEADSAFIDQLLDAITAFRIEIDRIEGKWKLSQKS